MRSIRGFAARLREMETTLKLLQIYNMDFAEFLSEIEQQHGLSIGDIWRQKYAGQEPEPGLWFLNESEGKLTKILGTAEQIQASEA